MSNVLPFRTRDELILEKLLEELEAESQVSEEVQPDLPLEFEYNHDEGD